ncbi:MAG: hypothetical protein KAI07_04530 [Deltaproteobacteria bacterium]|nr:hypothetical protein [Deltaproteobacteria bacterium]
MLTEEETITVPLSDYKQLQEDARFARCLQACGVDNWSGYEYAQVMFENGEVKDGD